MNLYTHVTVYSRVFFKYYISVTNSPVHSAFIRPYFVISYFNSFPITLNLMNVRMQMNAFIIVPYKSMRYRNVGSSSYCWSYVTNLVLIYFS